MAFFSENLSKTAQFLIEFSALQMHSTIKHTHPHAHNFTQIPGKGTSTHMCNMDRIGGDMES